MRNPLRLPLPFARLLPSLASFAATALVASAANPVAPQLFTADPTLRAFGDRLYLYTSHDEAGTKYFDMDDWRLLTTDDLGTWQDHGEVFSLKGFSWAKQWAWAPEAVRANGKYYLFLPTDRVRIGVAVGDKPEGPFQDAIGAPLLDNATRPEIGPEPIDPAVLIDEDGPPFLYFGCRQLKVVQLDRSLAKLAGPVQDVVILDPAGKATAVAEPGKQPQLPMSYGEAPFVFKRTGRYYLVYSNGWAKESTLQYAIGDSPTGPFTYVGEVMPHVNCVTHHASVAFFRGRWFLAYHTSDIPGGDTFHRAVSVDELKFDAAGKILPVVQTESGPAPFAAAAPAIPTFAKGRKIVLEAETAKLEGTAVVSQSAAGFSGEGYVSGIFTDADKLTLTFRAPAGLYDVALRYRAPLKGFNCTVNGRVLTGKFPDSEGKFRSHAFGKIELRDGENTLALHGGWHGYAIDAVELTPAAAPALPAVPPATLCDPQATPAAQALFNFLRENYGRRTLSGAIQYEADYVFEKTGKRPAIVADDLMDVTTTPIRYAGIKPGQAERMIELARAGHILTWSWHWRSPSGLLDRHITRPDGTKVDARWYKGFYTEATTFDLATVLAHPESPDYVLLMTDLDMLAGELRKFDDLDIPILWRPLHESEGKWFWWGAKGPGPFKQLWRLVHERFTGHHGLHNLVWVFTGGANSEWYPGDDVVDIVGIDEYPKDVRDPLSATWDETVAAYSGRKLVALSEFGGVPDLPAASRLGVRWSYFASWNYDLGPKRMPVDDLRRIYHDKQTLSLDEVPKDRWPIRATPRER